VPHWSSAGTSDRSPEWIGEIVRIVLVVVALVIVVGVVVWFVASRRHPEMAATHRAHLPTTRSERIYGDHPVGPAGADAEDQRPDDTGSAWDGPMPPRS
jgi:hypothetical protein